MVELTGRVDGLRAEIEEVRSSTLWWSLTGLFLAAITLYGVAAAFPDPFLTALPGVILLLLAVVVWLLLQASRYLLASWALVISCFAVNVMLIVWSGLAEAVIFLALPVGLTAVLIGLPGSIATAIACTLALEYGAHHALDPSAPREWKARSARPAFTRARDGTCGWGASFTAIA